MTGNYPHLPILLEVMILSIKYAANLPLYCTAEPENIKAVLAGQFQDFGKGKKFHEQWKEFLGDSIFATDGSQWHGSRQLIRPQFQKSRISDLHTFEKHIQKMLALVPRDGSTVDISDLWYRFTLDSATDFLLGENVGSLDNPRVEFAKAFADVQKFQNDVMRSGYARFFPTLAHRLGGLHSN